jgi:hypothetical protein
MVKPLPFAIVAINALAFIGSSAWIMYYLWDIEDDDTLKEYEEEEFVWISMLCYCSVMAVAGIVGLGFVLLRSKMLCMLFAVFAGMICLASLAASGSLGWGYSKVVYDLGTVEDCEDSHEDMASAAAKATTILCTSQCPC